jgi:hypothetical protein
VWFNPAQRAVMAPHRLSACLFTGTDKIRRTYGNGDCLLLDLRNCFFAVADGSERWPSASSDFLRRLAGRLMTKPRPEEGQAWLTEVNKAYASQRRLRTTTFGGVVIEKEEEGQTLRVIHGGDSRVLLINLKTKRLDYSSPADMNFAGRSRALSGMLDFRLGSDPYRILLATDGIGDLARLLGLSVEALCLATLRRFRFTKSRNGLKNSWKVIRKQSMTISVSSLWTRWL